MATNNNFTPTKKTHYFNIFSLTQIHVATIVATVVIMKRMKLGFLNILTHLVPMWWATILAIMSAFFGLYIGKHSKAKKSA